MTVIDKIFTSFFVSLTNFWNLLTSFQFTAFGYSVNFGHLMLSIVIVSFFLSVVIKR